MKRKSIISLAILSSLTLGTVSVLSSCGGEQQEEEVENLTVTWSGVEAVTLQMGDPTPDRLAGVRATASNGEELEVEIDEENSQTIDTGWPGTYTVYYYALKDGERVDPDNTGYAWKTFVVERGTTLDNSTFDTGTAGWSGNGNAGSVMSYSWDESEKALKVDIETSGQEYWQNQVEYNGLNLLANTTYVISLDVKSTNGRNIGASLEVPSLGYQVVEAPNCLGVPTTVGEYSTVEFYYTTGDQGYEGVKLGILLGRFTEKDDEAATVWIDNVNVTRLATKANSTGVTFENTERVTINNFSELEDVAPVTATDSSGNDITSSLKVRGVVPTSVTSTMTLTNWALEYSYEDAQGNLSYVRRQFTWEYVYESTNEHDAYNADFDDGSLYWNEEENGIVDIEFVDGTAVITSLIEGATGEPDWRAQIQQNNAGNKLTAGKTYKLVVEAKTTNTNVRTLRGEFCAGAGNPNAKFDLVFDAVDTYQTFESAPWTPESDVTGGGVRVGLLLAEYSESYVLTVDSIHIVEVTE